MFCKGRDSARRAVTPWHARRAPSASLHDRRRSVTGNGEKIVAVDPLRLQPWISTPLDPSAPPMVRRTAFCALALSAVYAEGSVVPDPLPATPEELVCSFVADLDQLSEEAGLAGPFDDERLTQSFRRARRSIAEAREAAFVPDLPHSFRALRTAMRELEKGDAVPVSGHGSAADLASLGSFFGEVFTGSLINLASHLGSVPEGVMGQAVSDFEKGVAERNLGEWERGVAAFGKAVRLLDAEMEIGPPCVEETE